MRHRSFFGIVAFVLIFIAWTLSGCSRPDAKQEVVASANGENIKVFDVRENLGMRGGAVPLPEVPAERKKEALDRAIAVRLLAQQARLKGLDNTDQFRSVVAQNARGVLVSALFRREIASRLKVSEDDVASQAKKLMASDNSVTEIQARGQARRVAVEEKLRKIEEDLVAAARKEFPVFVNQELVGKIGKGEKVADEAILATAGADKVTYGEAKKLMSALAGGGHGAQDLSRNAAVLARLLDREATGMALAAYARKQGIEGSEWAKAVRDDLERSVLANMLAEKEILKDVSVTDKEIAAAYAEHAQMFVRDGKQVPLSAVKTQIRDFLVNDKRRKALEAYIADLRRKAKITINEEVLSKV